MNIYWGDLHNHCGITYGFGSLENALERAKSQLDFCSITGHAMWPDMYEERPETAFVVNFHKAGFQKLKDHWEEDRKKIADANSQTFVTFQGYEMHSSRYGDHHVLTIDDHMPLKDCQSPDELVKLCGDAIAVPHHIGYTPGYRGINWDAFINANSPVVEVYSKHGCAMDEEADYPYYHNMGPRDSRNTVMEGLRRGYKFGFVGSTDHHAGFPGSYGDGLAAVLAEKKTRESLFAAIKARRTYAVTGDRILCDFRVNDAIMGSEITAANRRITGRFETEYALDKIVLYKNGRPVHVINGQWAGENRKPGRYKIRVEFGWGNSSLYHWDGAVDIEGGSIAGYRTYFRGQSVLAPSAEESYDEDGINDICTEASLESEKTLLFSCDTVGNKSTLHPSTSAVLVEVEGDERTKVTVRMNHKSYTASISQLLEYGYTAHMEYYHSQAFKIHRALPGDRFTFELDWTDGTPEKECDFYHVEVAQKNHQWAYVSPVFVNA